MQIITVKLVAWGLTIHIVQEVVPVRVSDKLLVGYRSQEITDATKKADGSIL